MTVPLNLTVTTLTAKTFESLQTSQAWLTVSEIICIVHNWSHLCLDWTFLNFAKNAEISVYARMYFYFMLLL